MTTGYEPLFELKKVEEEIWVVDGESISFYGMPFPTRMTVIRLKSGELFLHSPVECRPELLEAIRDLGPVRYMVAPNWIHYAYLPGWQDACEGAQVWVAPGVKERAEKYGVEVRIDGELEDEVPEGWRGEIHQRLVEGHKVHREVVFFHVASQTLIVTDLIENFEKQNLPCWARGLAQVAGTCDPDGKAPLDMRMGFRFGELEALRESLREVLSWEPERVILAHGRWYKKEGMKELRRAFRWVPGLFENKAAGQGGVFSL